VSEDDRAKWNARWSERGEPAPPSRWLDQVAALLPARGRALDVAGGSGRHALWLARRGLAVTLTDVSEVAVGRAEAAAAAAGLALAVDRRDLEVDPLPDGPWQIALCFHFLLRPLFAGFAAALAPGGLLLFVQPTVRNLERHPHPGAPYLLAEGELPGLIEAVGLEVVRGEEGWLDEGRHEARVVARRRPGRPRVTEENRQQATGNRQRATGK
jgi:SAM-dependent methyltransferase